MCNDYRPTEHALAVGLADKCKSRGTTRGSATRKEEKKMKKILMKLSTLMITPNYEKYKWTNIKFV